MKTLDLINQFEETANDIQTKFAIYMFWEDCKDSGEWIWNDPSWVTDFFEWWYFFHLSDMYEILKYKYAPAVAKAFYEYNVSYRWEECEYWINLKNFAKLWDGSDIDEWAKKYHADRDKNRNFWNSPAGKKKEEETLKPLVDDFKKEMEKYIDNKK